MIPFFFLLAFQGPTADLTLELRAYLRSPVALWQDLDGDGQPDIWVADEEGETIWVWRSGRDEPAFLPLTLDPRLPDAEPKWEAGHWYLETYADGVRFRGRTSSGWQAQPEPLDSSLRRPGMNGIRKGLLNLMPTHDGYWLFEESCLLQKFRLMPAIQLNAHSLKLTYPVPQWGDLDGDPYPDLIAPPVAYAQHREWRIWSAIGGEAGFTPQWAALQFGGDFAMEAYQTGDFNGDGVEDLIVLARPSKNISLFEELSLLIYLGEKPGQWASVPSQLLKTKQNLWQTGPMEISEAGVFLYYYKGLIRSHFRIDLFAYQTTGYIEPKPVSRQWTLKDADRETILLDFDINGDGFKDLILRDRTALKAYIRQTTKKAPPFDPKSERILFPFPEEKKGKKDTPDDPESMGHDSADYRTPAKNRARGHGGMALVMDENQNLRLWHMAQAVNGYWYLRRFPILANHP